MGRMKAEWWKNWWWGKEKISCYQKLIFVHLLISHQVVNTQEWKEPRKPPGNCPRCWCKLAYRESRGLRLPASFQKDCLFKVFLVTVFGYVVPEFCSSYFWIPHHVFTDNQIVIFVYSCLFCSHYQHWLYKKRFIIHLGFQEHFSK